MEQTNAPAPRRTSAKRKRDAEGQLICSCGCGRRPVAPRKTWFSDACVQAWKQINDPATIRAAVFKRDGGICAICGIDSNKAYKEWQQSSKEWSRLKQWFSAAAWRHHQSNIREWCPLQHKMVITFTNYHVDYREQTKEFARMEKTIGPNKSAWTSGRSSGWDADHIIPVIEGGGLCGLENYRTLCHPCHKKETAALAARRTQARRQQKAPALNNLITQ